MTKIPTRTSGVDYKAPGSDSWQRQESREGREARRDLLRRARSLLSEADAKVRRAGKLHQRRSTELLEFERGMAAALGAWDRWVEAGAKQLLQRSKEVVQESTHDAWEAVRRAFQIADDE
jgi:hypothetical protein